MTERPVVAAIPTYNMAEQATDLIGELKQEALDAIYVLDDNSVEDVRTIIAERLGDVATVVSGDSNLGAAGNRNRILNALKKDDFPPETAIVFIDADTRLEPDNPPLVPTVRKLLDKHPDAGTIGGKVLNADGSWGAFNYGPLFSFKYVLGAIRQLKLEALSKKDPDKARALWAHSTRLLTGWPHPFEEPKAASVGWLVETFTIVTHQTFAELGGYDASLRYCEGLDFGARLAKRGLKSIFDPTLTVRHLQVDNRGAKRQREVLDATIKLALRQLLHKY